MYAKNIDKFIAYGFLRFDLPRDNLSHSRKSDVEKKRDKLFTQVSLTFPQIHEKIYISGKVPTFILVRSALLALQIGSTVFLPSLKQVVYLRLDIIIRFQKCVFV